MSLPEKEPYYPLYLSTSLQPPLAKKKKKYNNNKKNKRQKPTQNSNK
jgi:hypothetical protein